MRIFFLIVFLKVFFEGVEFAHEAVAYESVVAGAGEVADLYYNEIKAYKLFFCI